MDRAPAVAVLLQNMQSCGWNQAVTAPADHERRQRHVGHALRPSMTYLLEHHT
jgi:hypothetical protein